MKAMNQTELWTMIGALAQVAGSIATFAAVYVALKLARDERRIKLRVTAGLRAIASYNQPIKVVAITVENIGHRTATIESLWWCTGYTKGLIPFPKFMKLQALMQMEDYGWAINERFPWILEPGKSQSTFFKREDFFRQFFEPIDGDLFRKLPLRNRWTLLNYRVGVGVTTLEKIYLGNAELRLKAALEAGYKKNI
jgi:hypothetical protein